MLRKRFPLCLIIIFFTTFNGFSQLKESLKLTSSLMKKEMGYSIYLPPDYAIAQKAYPIVYLLHGYTDDETAWTQFGQIDMLADKAIKEGTIPPMIIAMPDAGVTWYIDDHENKQPYEKYFIEEFMPHIEKKYRVRAKKEFRGIAGLSMGGYGSFLYAIKHPELFTAAAPLSAAFYTKDEVINYEMERWNQVEGVMYGKDRVGADRITPHWLANNPLEIFRNGDAKSFSSVKYYFDCGDDDFLYRGNAAMHVLLREKEIDHEFRVRDGAHNWTYWREGIIPALEFIGAAFRR